MSTPNLKDIVKEKYGEAALRVTSGASNSCCGGAAALESACDPINSNLYNSSQEGEAPILLSKIAWMQQPIALPK